jgi:hypothetical protein
MNEDEKSVEWVRNEPVDMSLWIYRDGDPVGRATVGELKEAAERMGYRLVSPSVFYEGAASEEDAVRAEMDAEATIERKPKKKGKRLPIYRKAFEELSALIDDWYDQPDESEYDRDFVTVVEALWRKTTELLDGEKRKVGK